MRILTDFHHAGLLQSLIMLFEGRLHAEVFRPIGMEWAEQGYWKVYDHPATQLQYLTTDQGYQPEDGTPPLNQIITHSVKHKGIYFCRDIDSGSYNRAITLQGFQDLDFDIVIASLPQHIEPFRELIKKYNPKAKLIFQVGNDWNFTETGRVDNVMASAVIPKELQEMANTVTYHQEFDTTLFKPTPLVDSKTVTSLMNVPDSFPDYQLLLGLEQALPGWKINIHGAQSRDGPKHGQAQVADAIKHSQFVWHVKAGGDGYGHVLFNTAACGVPTIVKKSYYAGKLGEKLLVDGKTCIDIDGLTIAEIRDKILFYTSNPAEYLEMRRNVFRNFRSGVNFDRDEEKIRKFLLRLK